MNQITDWNQKISENIFKNFLLWNYSCTNWMAKKEEKKPTKNRHRWCFFCTMFHFNLTKYRHLRVFYPLICVCRGHLNRFKRSVLERFCKTFNSFKRLALPQKCFIIDVWQWSKYNSVHLFNYKKQWNRKLTLISLFLIL